MERDPRQSNKDRDEGRGPRAASFSQLTRIERMVMELLRRSDRMEYKVMAKIDDLLKAVGDQTTIEQGVATLIDKLRADVLAAGGDTAKIQQAFDQVTANNAALSAKLIENTSAAGASAGGATS